MSFRHTFITEFIYRGNEGGELELEKVKKVLEEYTSFVEWKGQSGCGYFYGIIKDLNDFDTKNQEDEIVEKLKELGVRLKIVYENE